MQINGTSITRRQKALVRVALTREHERATDTMRILYQANLDHDTRARATTAILALTDETMNAILDLKLNELADQDEEAHQ